MNYVYLHVPKTGGNYVYTALNCDQNSENKLVFTQNHHIYIDSRKEVPVLYPKGGSYLSDWFEFAQTDVSELKKPDTVCFATVRNPFDWLVSFYSVVPEGINRTSFSDFVKTLASRKEDFWPSSKLIFFPFFSSAGNFLVDRLIHQHYGGLDFELQEFAESVDGFSHTQSSPKKVSEKRKGLDYRSFYTDELVKIVSKTWARELWLYGYCFDGRTHGFLNKVVPPEIKNKLKYHWDTDTLLFNGKEIVL
jgi:hypothetical protein